MSHAERTALSNAARVADRAARDAEYARLRRARYTPVQAVLRLGLSAWMASPYERVWQEAAAGERAA